MDAREDDDDDDDDDDTPAVSSISSYTQDKRVLTHPNEF